MATSTTKVTKSQLAVIASAGIQEFVASCNFDAASTELKVIADKHGDKVAALALEKMEPAALSVFLAQIAGKPSCTVAELVTPKAFGKAFAALSDGWSRTNPREAALDVEAVVREVIMQTEDGETFPRAKELLKSLAKDELGVQILAWWLSSNISDISHFANFGKWRKSGNEDSVLDRAEQHRQPLDGQLTHQLNVIQEDDAEADDVVSATAHEILGVPQKTGVHYCMISDELKAFVEKIPEALLSAIQRAWATKQFSENAYDSLFPPSETPTQTTTAESAL